MAIGADGKICLEAVVRSRLLVAEQRWRRSQLHVAIGAGVGDVGVTTASANVDEIRVLTQKDVRLRAIMRCVECGCGRGLIVVQTVSRVVASDADCAMANAGGTESAGSNWDRAFKTNHCSVRLTGGCSLMVWFVASGTSLRLNLRLV